MTSPSEPRPQALKACAQWLAGCLKAGWGRDSLDGLEALWWEHHDHLGQLKLYVRPITPPLVTSSGDSPYQTDPITPLSVTSSNEPISGGA